MSINYLLATWNHTPDLSPADTLLLMVLADQSGDEDRACFMKTATIAKKAKRSERSVRDGLATLEAEGYIEVIPRAGRSNILRLLYDHQGVRHTAEDWESDLPGRAANSAGGAANSAGGAANSADIYNSSYSCSTQNQRDALPGSANPDGQPPAALKEKKKTDPTRDPIYGKYTGEFKGMPESLRTLGKKARRRAPDAETGTAESA